jgi:hypothetical protein
MGWPNKETRERWDFVFKAIQSLVIVIGVLWAAYTFWDTRHRELQKPFDEKQLALYADAARVLAHLSVSDNPDPETTVRFWELYLGELPLVESTDDKDSIAAKMNEFCNKKMNNMPLCSASINTKQLPENSPQKIAVELAKKAREEIQSKWGEGRPTLLQRIAKFLHFG